MLQGKSYVQVNDQHQLLIGPYSMLQIYKLHIQIMVSTFETTHFVIVGSFHKMPLINKTLMFIKQLCPSICFLCSISTA